MRSLIIAAVATAAVAVMFFGGIFAQISVLSMVGLCASWPVTFYLGWAVKSALAGHRLAIVPVEAKAYSQYTNGAKEKRRRAYGTVIDNTGRPND